MTKILQFSFLFATMLLFSMGTAFAQGSTTGSMSGLITDGTGPLPGATIIALHEPTGSEYFTISNVQGNYNIKNMKVGRDYKITVSYVGFKDAVVTGVSINLGQNYNLNFTMTEAATELAVVAIVADPNDQFDKNRTGSETVISEREIQALPTVSRSINDFTRLTPEASITPGGGISIAGTNNRYNAIFIDGAVNNDVFGLAGNGQNGGQIGISPISIDAIEQFQVVVAPYDVRQGGFAGGGINAVTKSGTNQFSGTAYYLFRNQDLAGKSPGSLNLDDTEREKLPDFSGKTYGFSLGGPIIKDKLHFFTNVEIQRDETPRPFNFGSYTGTATQDTIDVLTNYLDELGYNPGAYENTIASLKGEKFLVKLDWNISKKHKLTVRHQYTKGVSISPSGSFTQGIRFANSGINFSSVTNSSALELNSIFGESTNNLIIGFTAVRDNRGPMGDPFPFVSIDEGNIRFGSEQFSTANVLDQDIFTLTDNFDIYKGKHTITIGTHNEFYNIRNVFIRQNFGSYRFHTTDDFVNGAQAYQFDRSYSLVDDVTGDETKAAAKFKALQLGLYAQDEWRASSRLTLTMGLRIDVPMFLDNPIDDGYFNVSAVDSISKYGSGDLKGAQAGKAPGAQLMFSPRVGFNWKLNDEGTTQLRGGLGIFTSRVPFVWPGAMYNNNGATVGGVRAFDVDFVPEWDQQPTKGDLTDPPEEDQIPQGQMDLFSKDFKFPQILRGSLAIDHGFGKGWVVTLEGMYSKTLNNVFYENLNLKPSTETLGGTPDNRPVFNRRDEVDDTYTRIILGSNTSDGYAYNLTAQIKKSFNFGLGFFAAYSYGDSYAVFEGTSSQNSSQWRGTYSVVGRNNTPLGRSDFSMGHRVVSALSYRIEYGGKGLASSITLFYNAQSGTPLSYIYNDFGGLNNEDSRERSLVYIPNSKDEIFLGDIDGDGNFVAADDAMWNALNAFIENDPYLSQNRGNYAEKNTARTPFIGIMDIKFSQDFFLQSNNAPHKLTVAIDIFNFTNLLNKDWGKRYNSNFGSAYLMKYEGKFDDGNTENIPVYSFDDGNKELVDLLNVNDSGVSSSRWQGQITIRYTF